MAKMAMGLVKGQLGISPSLRIPPWAPYRGQFDCSLHRGGQRCFWRRCFCGQQRSAGAVYRPPVNIPGAVKARTCMRKQAQSAAARHAQTRTRTHSTIPAAPRQLHAQTLTRSRAPILTCSARLRWPGRAKQITFGNAAAAAGGLSW